MVLGDAVSTLQTFVCILDHETSAPYTTYGDDYKHFNLELSKLQLL